MGVLNWLRIRAAAQPKTGGKRITSSDDLERAIRQAGLGTASGVAVTPESAMRVAAVYGCVRLVSGAVGNMPIHVKERVDDLTRRDLPDHPLWRVLRRRPNGWQTPSQLKRMLTAHLLLRGNAYAMIVRSRGLVVALHPLDPDRMRPEQGDDLTVRYVYRRRDGREVRLAADEVMHLVGLTLDGVTGLSVISYAKETIGLSLSQERHGAMTMKSAARPSIVLRHPSQLSKDATENLVASLERYRQGGESEGKALILEEGMETSTISMTPEDVQWIESRSFSRGDIAMFFGVPPHMIGDTDKATSWGTGIENMGLAFVKYTLEDPLTTWEETISRDLIGDDEPRIYARFNRDALLRGDSKTRTAKYQSALQWGWMSPNDVRALEDMNPREGGDVYYDPPNTAGGQDPSSADPAPEE
jgi:HK97 family phage portal protein